MRYPKLNTIWKRDDKTHKIIEGDYSRPEFKAIDKWQINEKVHGTNTRIMFERIRDEASGFLTPELSFGGKTDDAVIPKPLMKYLEKTFNKKQFEKQFVETKKVVLYGEGYGKKIQDVGRLYREDNSFILFDAWIDGWWLEPESVRKLAKDLGIDSVPDLGVMSTEKAIEYIKSNPDSKISKDKLYMEGIVARSYPLMQFRHEKQLPIMWKLKAKDYFKN